MRAFLLGFVVVAGGLGAMAASSPAQDPAAGAGSAGAVPDHVASEWRMWR